MVDPKSFIGRHDRQAGGMVLITEGTFARARVIHCLKHERPPCEGGSGQMQRNIARPESEYSKAIVEGVRLVSFPATSSWLLEIGQINQWQRGARTRHLQFLIDAQEDRSIDRQLDIRTFSKKSIVELHGSSKVAEPSGRGCRCLCRTGAHQPETLMTFSRS